MLQTGESELAPPTLQMKNSCIVGFLRETKIVA